MTPILDGHRDGKTYEAEFDYRRLNRQARLVYDAMCDGSWRSLKDIADKTGQPEASISARLRDLRKPRFGKLIVERKRHLIFPGVWLYRLAIEAVMAA